VGRLEKLLLVLVGALILFVGVQMVRAPRRVPPPVPVAQQGVEESPEPDATPTTRVLVPPSRTPRLNDLLVSARSSQEPPPMRDLVEIRSKLLAGQAGTYIGDMLAAQDSVVFRWPERRVNGIRVWVDDGRNIRDWSRGFADMARSVFDEWQFTGSPLRFEFVLDTVSSDIRVHWIDNFASQQIGSATRLVDQSNWIVGADITIAVHDSVGRAFSPTEITGIVRHEVGHALGLGHSADRRTLMFPEETMFDIAPADQLTLKLIYSIPPGAVNK
jgi:hypothetical protein